MKKLYIKLAAIALAALTLLSSCKDFLDSSSNSTYTSERVFESLYYTDFAIVGIYSAMIQNEVYHLWYYSWNTDIEHQQFDAGSYNDSERRSLGNYLCESGHPTVGNPWVTLYKAIERANLCIEGIQESDLYLNGTDAEKAQMGVYLGEALTLRAYIYYDIVRNWGDVPFKTMSTQTDGSNFFQGKTDRDEILEQLLEDLQFAATLVPWYGESSYTVDIERVTKGFVKGLRAKIALQRGGYSFRKSLTMERGSDHQKYYQIARDECADIIGNGTHKLNPNFGQYWKNLNGWLHDPYNEPLMEFGYTMGSSGEAGYISGWRYDASDAYGYGNMGSIQTNPAFFYSYDQNDDRKFISVGLAKYGSTGAQEPYTDARVLTVGKWNRKWINKEYVTAMAAATGKIVSGVNWVPIRMADVYLMYAEAINEISSPDASVEAANGISGRDALRLVRARAFASADDATYTNMVDNYVASLGAGSSFFEAIVNERAWEFVGEGIRKWDLIRWNMLTEKVQEMRANNLALVQGQAPYHNVPRYVYYKYDVSDPQELDYADLNNFLYQDNGTAPAADVGPDYTRLSWFPMTYSDPEALTEISTWLQYYGCGLDGSHPGVSYVRDRHLLPLHQSVVDDSAGHLTNDYGF